MAKKDCIFYFGILALIFIITNIISLGSYPLMDPDETRYVTMARDMFLEKNFLTLYLNGDFFFEKPPLFFWLECLSFKMLSVSEFSARIPVVLLSLLPASFLFILCKKTKDIKFAFLTTGILTVTLEYIIITKMAILDGVFTSFCTGSIFAYFYTFFCREKNKKYFWFLSYVLCAFAALAKGAPGVILPFLCVFASSIVFKNYKEILKYSFLGIILFLAIVLPWHIIMLKNYNPLFFDEYIFKHHILRFLGSEVIHRNEPFYFYILTLLWGLFPFIFSFIFDLLKKCKEFFKTKTFNIKIENDFDKLYILSVISIIVILLFFSSSKTKLITYTLPVYPFFAVITGKIWYEYIYFDKNEKIIKNSILFFNYFLTLAYIVSLFGWFYIEKDIYFTHFTHIQRMIYIIFTIYLLLSFTFIDSGKKLAQFLSIVFFMAIFSSVFTPLIHKFDFALGQDDLIKFAKLAKENNYTLSTYRTGKKYSLLYYSGLKKVNFYSNKNELKNEPLKEKNYLIVKNKYIEDLNKKPNITHRGRKYSLIIQPDAI